MKSLALVVRPLAETDVDEASAYLDDHAPEAGTRFLHELAHVYVRLTTFPQLGPAWIMTQPQHLPDVRRVVLPSFPYSVFYRATNTNIAVLRVLHHSRDLAPALE